jgi:hypothetical protein
MPGKSRNSNFVLVSAINRKRQLTFDPCRQASESVPVATALQITRLVKLLSLQLA